MWGMFPKDDSAPIASCKVLIFLNDIHKFIVNVTCQNARRLKSFRFHLYIYIFLKQKVLGFHKDHMCP